MTNIRAMRYVEYQDVPDYLLMGWIAYEPTSFGRLHLYGIVMQWICDCRLPGEA